MYAKKNLFMFVCLIALCVVTSSSNTLDENETEEVVFVAENFQEDPIKVSVECVQTKWGCFDPSDAAVRPRLEVDDEDKEEQNDELSFRRHCQCIHVPGVGCVYPCDSPVRP